MNQVQNFPLSRPTGEVLTFRAKEQLRLRDKRVKLS